MRDYELTILLPAVLSAQALEKQQTKVAELLKKTGAKVAKESKPQKKNLAYPINDAKEAYFWYQEFSAKPEVILELDKKLKLEDNLVRHLIVVRG